MPVVLLLFLIVLLPFAILISIPFTLVQRYRMGTARRQARGWMAVLNMVALGISSLLLLLGAALANLWLPHTVASASAGLLGGALLGLVGLWLSRWETAGTALHVTPNRWLVLGITLVVAFRIGYGFWRGWHTWHHDGGATSWLVGVGPAGMLAAGGLVLGYYFSFWSGLRRRLRRHERRVGPRPGRFRRQ